MASVGERPQAPMVNYGSEICKDPMYLQAKSLCEQVDNIQSQTRKNLFLNPYVTIADEVAQRSMVNSFVNEMVDIQKQLKGETVSLEEEAEMRADYENLAYNDINDAENGMLRTSAKFMQESQGLNVLNPMVAMTFPMHVNLMTNTVFGNGAIPRKVANNFIVTRSMEIRYFEDIDGQKYDMAKQQDKLYGAYKKTEGETYIDVALPENYTTDFVVDYLGGAAGIDHIEPTTKVSGICVENVLIKAGELLPSSEEDGCWAKEGAVASTDTVVPEVWYHTDMRFHTGLGELDCVLTEPITGSISYTEKVEGGEATAVTISEMTYISGTMKNDRISLFAAGHVSSSKITKARIWTKLDASSRTKKTPTVGWTVKNSQTRIGTNQGLSAKITPEMMKDVGAAYGVNQVTKLMGLLKTAQCEIKDNQIKTELYDSFKEIDPESKFIGDFDFAPKKGYDGDPEEWRHRTFFSWMNRFSQKMIWALNDPNMTFSMFCNPILIDLLGPLEVSFQSPKNIGNIQLDFSKVVVTPSNGKVYQFVGSDKLRDIDEICSILCPRGTNRVTYEILDYQFYISNEIRDNAHPAIPQITTFDRWILDKYQPVQGRINIINSLGYREGESATTTPRNFVGM